MHLLFCGTGWGPIVEAIRVRLPRGASISARDPAVPVAEAARDVQVLLPSNVPVGPLELRAAPRLELIQQPAAGVDGIDVAAARAHGIPVCNAPGNNADALAEAALLLMLAVYRRLQGATRALARGQLGVPLGRELRGKRLGLVGFGQSARKLARLAEGLDMLVRSVRSFDPRGRLLELLAWSDLVSIHCPLTEATRDLFDEEAFESLRAGAVLINAARGPIVKRSALEAALASGRLGGVGLDVGWKESWPIDDPLLARDDVLVLPHVGGSTEEAFGRIADTVVENLRRLRGGQPLLHRIV